jgi:hypothetical protein
VWLAHAQVMPRRSIGAYAACLDEALASSRQAAYAPLRRDAHADLRRSHFDLVGHDKPFFADQGDSAVEKRAVRIIVTNQFTPVN